MQFPGKKQPLKTNSPFPKDTDEEMVVNVKNNRDSFLIVADSFYPGWQALIDGQPTEIYPANINQRALFVKGGNHQIRFSFISQSFELGKKISIVAYIVWTGFFIVVTIMGRSHPDSMDDSG